tara:strand:+ start:536 stop:751 length:216 start_codon:yes stop_codon:yes gene_type:complete
MMNDKEILFVSQLISHISPVNLGGLFAEDDIKDFVSVDEALELASDVLKRAPAAVANLKWDSRLASMCDGN